jgi:hypothetical protein
MRALLLALVAAATMSAQSGRYGIFTESSDVGAQPIKGSTVYNAATGEYTVTGSGTDIWAKVDEFHYLWRQISGDFSVTATTKFLTDGNPHRKASIMLRKDLDTNAAFVHLAIHGDGMPSIQFRSTKDDTVNTLDFPIGGPGVWALKLVRQGSAISTFVGKEGQPLVPYGSTQTAIGNPVMVGLAVASHTRDAVNTVVFSNVSIEPITPPRAAPKK